MSAPVNEGLRQVEVFHFPGLMVELYQGQFDLLVSRDPVALTLSEIQAEVIRKTAGSVQELVLSCGMIIGDGALDHMPGTVHLMFIHVSPFLLRSHESVVAVEIAVVVLGRGDEIDYAVGTGLEGLVRMVHK